MSTLALFMGLLLLSYLGNVLTWISGRGKGGAGLPAGSEFLVLGILAGPLVFRVATRESLAEFDPMAYVGVGWLAVSSGLEYGFVGERRVPFSRILLGILLTVGCGVLVGLVTFRVIPFVADLRPEDRLVLALGVGIVCAETTRHASEWLVERHRASGPLTELLTDLAHSDELVPIAAVAVLFALRTPARAIIHMPSIGWAGATLAVGLLLGVLTALLLARDLRVNESWGTILGTSLMTIGLAARLDLAGVTAMFALGATIAWVSRHRSDIRAMVVQTERAVLLPALVLAGARIDPSSIGKLWMIAVLAIALRIVGKLISGFIVRFGGNARDASPLLGLSLLSSGGMTIATGLAIALRFPGRVGDTVLAAAVGSTLFGELVGTAALRRTLDRAGEIPPPSEPRAEPEGVDEGEPADGEGVHP